MKKIAGLILCLVLFMGAGTAAVLLFLSNNGSNIKEYEKDSYTGSIYQGQMFAQDLCVASDDVQLSGFEDDTTLHGAALFDLENESVVYGYNLYDRLYPASTTKVLTAYVALKYGNLEDQVTVSANATDFNWDESICGLQTGDTLSMYDLLCGLMLVSGNDAAAAIAEHISGSTEEFAELMNREAAALGATGTHFVNPHGLPDDNHYTTVYDLYLFFNACMKDERFVDIISMDSYTVELKGADGTVRTDEWEPTHFYASGEATAPEGIHIVGGKTGTTLKAGNCVILYEEASDGSPYISVIMGAETKPLLYEEMNRLLSAGIQK
ncbi:MAG TPA: serine hydrolase [Candidatus Mediterraneibacter avicola]|nr:serine hydrolase [Candidatus Mediterraneibacter avicola]